MEEAIDGYQEGRFRSGPSLMPHLRMVDGTIESFPYAYLTRVRFSPDDIIAMRFGKDEVRVTGRNLRICTVSSRRLQSNEPGSFRKARDGEEGLKPVDAVHVERIEIT